MRKLALVFALAVGLGGCTLPTVQEFSRIVQFTTIGVNNPVTKEQLYAAENSFIVVFAALKAYRTSCVRGAIPESCKQVVARIQVYTKRVPNLLASVRKFVRENDQVNAALTFRTLMELISAARGEAVANGVAVNG